MKRPPRYLVRLLALIALAWCIPRAFVARLWCENMAAIRYAKRDVQEEITAFKRYWDRA